MNKNYIVYAAIALLAGITGAYLQNRASSTNRPNVSTPKQAQAPGEAEGQKATLSPRLPASEPRATQRVPVDEKDIKKVRTYVRTEDIPRKEYSEIIKADTVRTYGKTVKGLGLSAEGQTKLMGFLIERSEVYRDVIDFVAKNPGVRDNEFRAMLAEAYATVDRQIEAAFSAEEYARIKDMIRSSAYLVRINEHYSPDLIEAGHPLTPEQMLPVARVMVESYKQVGSTDTQPTLTNIDPVSGLTSVDQTVLGRLTPILTPAQLELFREITVKRNDNSLQILRMIAAEPKK